MEQKKRIAIIGSGIAGLASAWLLSKKFDVTIYEKNDYIGGHTNTRSATFGDNTVWADTGFMVLNKKTYPNLIKMFSHLGVEIFETDMSFGVSLGRGTFEFSSDNVFVQGKNLLQPSFWRMLFDIVRFNKNAVSKISEHEDEISLAQLLVELKVSKRFSQQYLLPMAGAIWSTDKENILEFPAKKFISFCENHGLLTPKSLNPFTMHEERLQWYTVKNGSRTYVEKIMADMTAEILLSTGVAAITRSATGVVIVDEHAIEREFHAVVCASHPDQTLKILKDASAKERALLAPFVYTKNKTVMHSDISFMMTHTKKWPSWTYAEPVEKQIELSYYMSRLQDIPSDMPVVVTLNPATEVRQGTMFYQTDYEHPRFSLATDEAQNTLEQVQGERHTYFAGAWLGHGFHEDGLRSAVAVAQSLGADVPWRIDEV